MGRKFNAPGVSNRVELTPRDRNQFSGISTSDYIYTLVGSQSNMFPVKFFSNYVYWNSIFAGCVASLASRFHLWPYQPHYKKGVISGKNLEILKEISKISGHRIASYIFAAAEDEYDDKGCKVSDERVAHKDMAWLFIRGLYEAHGMDIKNRQTCEFTEYANSLIMKGYGVNKPCCFETLSFNLGFHVASEKLAAFEFQELAAAMQNKHPKLMDRLTLFRDESINANAADWVKVHGVVEEEHFQNALVATHILDSKTWMLPQADDKVLIFNDLNKIFGENFSAGFDYFEEVQKEFFKYFAVHATEWRELK